MRRLLQLMAALLMVGGCLSPAKKLARAQQMVMTDASAFDAVGVAFQALHPCINDTEANVVSRDTARDTLIMIQGGDLTHDTVSARDTVVITKTVTVHIRDTIKSVVIDGTLTRELTDSVNYYHISLATWQGAASTSKAEADTWESRYHLTLWIVALSGLVLLILIVALKRFL